MFALLAPARRRIFSLRTFLFVMLFAIGERAYAATCVVANTNQFGAGSMLSCINSANSGDTIDATGVTGTIQGSFTIHKNLTIIGPTSGQLAISGGNQSNVFLVYDSVSLTVENLTITGGKSSSGAGFGTLSNSVLTLINTIVTGNAASDQTFSEGGGISAEGSVILIKSTVTGNSASGPNASGGGVTMDGATLTLACGSTVTGNTAPYHPDIDGASTTSSTIFCVTSLADDGATGAGELNDVLGQANGVANSSVYFVGISGTISLSRNLPGIAQTLNIIGPGAKFLTVNGKNNGGKPVFQIFANRTVGISGLMITGAASQQEGGGIYSQGNLTLDKSVVAGNSTNFHDCGGGIYEDTGGTLTVTNSAVVGNSCTESSGYGGGILSKGQLVLVNSTVAGNTAPYVGGAATYDTASFVNSTITGNTALNRAGLESESSTVPMLVNTII